MVIALLSAMQAEIYHTVRRLREGGDEACENMEWGGKTFTRGMFGSIPVLAGWTGTGTTIAGISCQYVCSRWNPRAILFAGIGGGLNPAYAPGDIVAAGEVRQWDINASSIGIPAGVFPGEYNAAGKALSSLYPDPDLLAAAERVSPVPVRKGVFLSGNSFFGGETGGLPGMEGDVVDMESISVALAGLYNRVPVLLLRVIADPCDRRRPRDIRQFLDSASISIAAIFEAVTLAISAGGSS